MGKTYDLVVLGGGAGGLVVAAGASQLGAKVALVDPFPLGGDCLWTGCVPSKTLLYWAKRVNESRCMESFGLQVSGKPDLMAALERVREAIEQLQSHDSSTRFQSLGVDLYEGYGSFENPFEIRVGNRIIRGRRIVIATGSRPWVPPIPGLEESGYLTTDNLWKLKHQPDSMLVIGGGAAGVELAQALARFGINITLVERAPSLLSTEDEEIVPIVTSALEREGIRILTDSEVVKAKAANGLIEITVRSKGSEEIFSVDAVLVAAGRKPNTERLNLVAAGVETDRQGAITVNRRLQTSASHIYAVGDVIGRFPFTHAAAYEGKIAVGNALFGLRRKVDYQGMPWVTYTDPEVFHLGWTEREAREAIGDIQVYRLPLADVDRFVTESETEGLVKVITDRKGRILGAHAIGPAAGDWMQEIVLAKRFGLRLQDLSQVIHPYPTRSASVQKTADLYWVRRLFSGMFPRWTGKWIHWFLRRGKK